MYNLWLLGVMHLFNQMMYDDKRYRYWLRYFQIPIKRTVHDVKLTGYSKEKLAKFWALSSRYQNIYLKSVFIQGLPGMCLSALSYLFTSQKFAYLHTPPVFWTILMVSCFGSFNFFNQLMSKLLFKINFISLVSIGTMNLLITLGPIVHLFLTCKILRDRFTHVTEKLRKTTSQKLDEHQMNKHLHDFSLLIDELQRINFFWSKFMSFNYHLGKAFRGS